MSTRREAAQARRDAERQGVDLTTGEVHAAPDELHTRAPEVWCTAVELATWSPDDAFMRAFRRHSDAVKAWRDDHDGRHPCDGTTQDQRREAQLRALESSTR